MKKSLYIYLRVSSDKQYDDGFGLENQKELGQSICKNLGMVPIILNEGSKSSFKDDLENRPLLTQLLNDMKDGIVKHLWVYQMDRLSRNEDVSFQIKKQIQMSGVRLYVNRSEYSLDNPNDKLMFQMMSNFSEFDNTLRTERMRRGRISKVEKGGWKGGPTPYGYKNVEGKLVPHPFERKWINRIFKEYSKGTSIYEIKKILERNGVLTRRGNIVWSERSVSVILDKDKGNTHYYGYYNYTDKWLKKTVTSYHQRIVSPTLEKSVSKRFGNREKYIKGTYVKTITLLKDYLECSHCGNRYGQRINKSDTKQLKNHYYCRGNEIGIKQNPIGSEKVCKIENGRVRSLSINETDDFVWNTILDVLSKSHIYKEMYKSESLMVVPTKEEKLRNTQNLRRRNKKIDKEILSLDDSRNNMLVEMGSLLSKDELIPIIKKYEDKKMELLLQKENIMDEMDTHNTNSNWVDWVKKFGSEIEDLRNTNMSVEDKKDFISRVLEKIIVSTVDKNTHMLDIHFNNTFIKDGFEWNFKKVNGRTVKDGYTVTDGSKNIVSKFRSVRTKKKSLETIH